MLKYLKNQRGDFLLEMIIIIAVIAIIPIMLISSKDKIFDVENKLADDSNTQQVQQVEEPVEEPVNAEDTKQSSKTFLVIIGIILGVAVVSVGAIFLIEYVLEKKRRGPQNLNEVLTLMIRKKPKKVFTLVKGTQDLHQYEYSITKYRWYLEATPAEIDVKMERKGKTVLHITYDRSSDTFLRKNVKAYVSSDEKTLKNLDKLIEIILTTKWDEYRSFNLLTSDEDIDQELPVVINKVEEVDTELEHTIITDPMLVIEAQLEEVIVDSDVKELFQMVIENMHTLRNYHMELDIETKHIIEYSLTNDLNRLLSLYSDLNEAQKENLSDEIQERLYLMNEKIESIQEKLDEKKANEIKRALHLFDKRYQA